jgi:stage IV sporulation protein FB
MLGEPPRTQGDLHFGLFGIPVRIHPWFWLVAVLLGLRGAPASANMAGWLVDLVVWVVAVFLAILVHELGHALVMRAYGFSPWITLYGFGGLASYNPGHTYGSKGAGTFGQILISAAGPGAGFLLATLLLALVAISGYHVQFTPGGSFGFRIGFEQVGAELFHNLLRYILFISIFWGIINLLPVYPLDGGQIAREVFLRLNPREGIRFSLVLSMFTAAALAIVGLLQWRSVFMALFFGWMAYSSYAALEAYRRRGPW